MPSPWSTGQPGLQTRGINCVRELYGQGVLCASWGEPRVGAGVGSPGGSTTGFEILEETFVGLGCPSGRRRGAHISMGSIHPGEAPASTRGPPGCSGPSLLRLLLPRGWAQGEDTRPPPTMPGPPDPIRHLGGGRGVRGGVPTPSPGEGHLSGANGGAWGSWGLLPPECRARAPGAHSVGCGPPGSTRTSESLRRPSPGSRGDRSGGSLGAGCQKLCGVCMCSQVDHMIGTLPRLRGRAALPPQAGPSHWAVANDITTAPRGCLGSTGPPGRRGAKGLC